MRTALYHVVLYSEECQQNFMAVVKIAAKVICAQLLLFTSTRHPEH